MLSIWFPWSEVVSSFSVVQMHVWFHEASFWLRGAPQLCFGLIVNNAAGHRFSHLSRWTCKIPNEKNTLKSKRTIRANFSSSKFYENRCHRSWSHCSTGLVPVHKHLFHYFSSQQKICLLKCLFEHFILQLPLAFKHGNSPSIPRNQARMQWCLCPLSENSLQCFGHGEIDAKWWIGEIRKWWNQLVRPACSQVASAWPPKVKQTRENVRHPGETFPKILHEILICCAVRHGQTTQLLFGQPVWDLWVRGTAGWMDNVKAKALNIFHESNTSRLLPKFQHEGCILCKP